MQPRGHLWERDDFLALLYVMFSCVFYHFPIWCPGSDVVLDCIESESLTSFISCVILRGKKNSIFIVYYLV